MGSTHFQMKTLKNVGTEMALALQLPYLASSESMGNYDSDIVDADGVG
jgi:hypothetical protein